MESSRMSKPNNLSGLALAAAALFSSASILPAHAQDVEVDTTSTPVHCQGINSCKAMSACKTAQNACKGKNACMGKGFLVVPTQAECDEIKAEKAKK